jgi:AraC-like DNA-binding protein
MKYDRMGHEHGSARRDALLRRQLLLGGDFSAVAELFHLLDDSSRLRIFWLLCHTEACVADISAVTDMSSPAVSHHLRLLKDAGLVRSRREGKEVRYRAAETPACKLLHEMIEKTMEISCPQLGEEDEDRILAAYSAEQVETVRRMHDELLLHPERRVPIEELARRYLMNPTTLKEVFKAVYGDSLAAHMKEHRLEKAAELLRRSDESVAAVAAAVGYESPSRFSAAFRARYHLLPNEYRRAAPAEPDPDRD